MSPEDIDAAGADEPESATVDEPRDAAGSDMEPEAASGPESPPDRVVDSTVPPGGWDFALMMATLVFLAALGVQSILGTGYTWWAENSIPGWQETSYAGYVALMNAVAAPSVLGLVVVLGLCVPKRVLSRTALLAVSAALVLAGFAGWAVTGSLSTGLGIYLALASLLQAAVVVMTFLGARSLRYMTEGRIVKTGSGLLHMGFLVFALVVVSLQQSPLMLPVFALSALLVTGGTVLSFYAGAFVRKAPERA
jgi:hypothetical protein